jgi:Fe-S cluster biogenesis protein NfuA/nitrite reductase/ring-hydroxylating ferredoxin subunit
MAAVEDRAAHELLERIDALLDGADDRATELAAALLELYGEGLARIAAQVPDAAALAGDELVSHLLLVHGLHPVPLEARVREALDSVRPYLDSHGGGVELLSLDDGVVRLRLEGSCSGCPSSTVTLKSAIEDAIHAAAPDVERIEAEGVPEPAPAQGLLQIEPAPRRAWAHTEALDLDGGATVVRDVEGEPMLFLRLDARTYAYRSPCPSCGGSLGDAVLSGTQLECPGCGHRYDARRAGRCVDTPELHLDPVPLLVEHDGGLKVALGT